MSNSSKAGVFDPGHFDRTFSRVPLELIAFAVKHGMPTKWGVLFYLLRYSRQDDSGNLLASCARSVVCAGLGITESQARTAVSSLIKDGVLSVVRSGGNGRATVYRVDAVGVCPEATPTHVGVSPEATPTERLTDCRTAQPTPTQDDVSSHEERGMSRSYPYSVVGVCPEATPNRTFKEGSYEPPSYEELRGAAEDISEGPIKGPEEDARGYLTDLKPVGTGEGSTFADLFHGRGCKL